MKKYFNSLKLIVDFKYFTFFYLVSLFVILTFLEVLSISIIYPFVKFILSGELIFFDDIYNKFGFSLENVVIFLCILLIFSFVFKNIFSYFLRVKITKYCWKKLIILRKKISNFYISMPYEEFLDKGKVNIITSVRDYTRSIMQGFEALLKLIGEIIVLVSILIYLFYLNYEVTLIVFVLMLFFGSCYFKFFSKKLIFNGKRNLEGEKILNLNLINLFSGFQEIKAINKEEFFINRLTNGAEKISQANINNQKINLLPKYFLEVFIISFGLIYILYSYQNGISGDEIISTLSVYSFAALRLLPGLIQINLSLNEINYSKPPVSFILEDLKKINSKIGDQEKIINNINLKNVDEKFKYLELKDIRFKYKNSEKYIIDDINLNINKNEFIGITGQSGIGKSSLIGIIIGLLKQSSGEYNLYSNQNTKLSPKNLISFLGQEPIVIDGSLEDNIVFSEREVDFNQNKIKESIKFSDLENFISSLRDKEKTLVGENGITLSIGQKQRLALARCFYADREIMILDEPSSALDEKTQDNIFNNLKFLKGKKTIVVITHNKKTLKYCDKVYLFSKEKLEILELNEKY